MAPRPLSLPHKHRHPQPGAESLAPPAVALLAVARAEDGAVLARLEDKASEEEELKAFEATLGELLDIAANIPVLPGGWKASQGLGDEGCVYVLADPQGVCVVAAAVRRQYPERMAQALLQELAKEVRLAESEEKIEAAEAEKLTGSLKGKLRVLMRKYSEQAKMDKKTEVHEKVDLVKGLMEDNVKKILETHVTIDSLESKSSSLSTSANLFLKESASLRRQVQARNFRVKLVFVASAAALALYVSLPLLGGQ